MVPLALALSLLACILSVFNFVTGIYTLVLVKTQKPVVSEAISPRLAEEQGRAFFRTVGERPVIEDNIEPRTPYDPEMEENLDSPNFFDNMGL